MDSESERTGPSRRAFLKTAGVGTAMALAPAMVAGAAKAQQAAAPKPTYSERIVIDGLGFLEGICFDKDSNMYVGDLDSGKVHKVTPSGEKSVFIDTGGGISSSKVGPDGALWILNNGGRTVPLYENTVVERGGIGPPPVASQVKGPATIMRADLKTGKAETIFTAPKDYPGANDLVFDAFGNFYMSSGTAGTNGGEVWFCSSDRKLSKLAGGYDFSNGIMVSDDGKSLYVSEYNTGVIWKHAISEPGKIANRVGFGLMPPVLAPWRPKDRDNGDSMTLDGAGNVLVCGYSGGQIAVFNPAGDLIDRVRMQDQWTTNAAFGVKDETTLYVTQSKLGRVAAIPWRTKGMRLFPLR